jgi:hypothetical protein
MRALCRAVCDNPPTPKGEFQPNGWTWISYLESHPPTPRLFYVPIEFRRGANGCLAKTRVRTLDTLIPLSSVWQRMQLRRYDHKATTCDNVRQCQY